MGNFCARSEPDDSVTRPKFSIGKDYREIEGQTSGEGIKKTIAWKASVTRPQLDAKREEFWRTRTTGRRSTWLAIKSAVEADHATAAVLLQMAGITTRDNCITVCEDANGNIYEIPPFIINDPVAFANEKKHRVNRPTVVEHELLKLKLRRPGKAQDVEIEIESQNLVSLLKEEYSKKEEIPAENVRIFFGGKELKDENTLLSYFITNEMVLMVFLKQS